MEKSKSNPKRAKANLIILGVFALIVFGLSKISGSSDSASLSPSQMDSASRAEVIGAAFSKWDGSHNNLVQYVKSSMNDPKSFELVDTRYWDLGKDTIVIKMKYRGKNAFGGTVTESVRAEANISGDLIKVEGEN